MKIKQLRALILGLLLISSFTGYNQCLNVNDEIDIYTAPPSPTNFWVNNHLTNWKVSHGTPIYSAAGTSLGLQSSYTVATGNSYGEGVYTDYNFIAGVTYLITYDIHTVSPGSQNTNNLLKTIMTNSLTPSFTGNSTIPSVTSSYPVTTVSLNPSVIFPISMTATITPTGNFNQLWFYLHSGPNSSTPISQATCTILNVCIKALPPTVIATEPSISLCCSDGPITFGTEWMPTGNVYWTNDYFTPTDGYPAGINAQVGGEFINLPPCGVEIETIYIPSSTIKNNGYKVYRFNPCECGPGVYPIEYQYTNAATGLSSSATMNITVNDSPTVTFNTMTIDLCTATGPIVITPLTNGVNCTITGQHVSLNQFNPVSAGVGTHTIQISCESASGCSTTITGTIIVEENAKWHNTSSKAIAFANQGDSGNDIYTDKQGYVYSTGHFYKGTVFEDQFGNTVQLTSNSIKHPRFYTVCYNSCGELQWVIYDRFESSSHLSSGFGVGKSNDELFVGLNYGPKALFRTKYPDGTIYDFPINASGTSSAIGNVCILGIDGPNTNTFGRVNGFDDDLTKHKGTALDLKGLSQNGSHELFVCGASDIDNNFIPKVFYSKIKYTALTNQFSVVWEKKSLDESQKHIANDLKWDRTSSTLCITGRFSEELSLQSSSSTTSGVYTNAIQDAFFATVNSNGYLSILGLKKLGIGNGQVAEGTTLTSSDNGYLYIGGNYKGEASSPFTTFGLPSAISTNNSNGMNSFLFSYRWSTNTPKFESIWNVNSYTYLTGIDALDKEVVFTGYYGEGIPSTSLSTNIAGYNSSSTLNQIFVGQVDISNGNWYQPEIVNSTLHLGSGNHRSTRATVGKNKFAYLTGTYNGKLSYFSGNPASGMLNSTGSNALVYNAFFMRQELSTNQLRSTLVETDTPDEENIFQSIQLENEKYELTAFPNPTSDIITVTIKGAIAQELIAVELYNPLGQIVYKRNVTTERFNIDVSNYKKGIYILKVKLSDSVEVLRIVKS